MSEIFLKDYSAPNFSVQGVDLTIALFDDHAITTSKLQLVRESAGDLVLFGRDIALVSIMRDGQDLAHNKDDETLSVALDDVQVGQSCTLQVVCKINPNTNKSLEGLYLAGDGDQAMYVTQCEPEGFRKITYYLDRPDVMSVFRVRLEASTRFKTLLANGNLLEQGPLDGERHFAVWEDPIKKPSYLFACVFANLEVLEDSFTTSEGRKVLLQIYANADDLDKCHVAMDALKASMRWDEENYGCAYDLDRFMIVATGQFNMGAMENKGLNIFNTACVLADKDSATDNRSTRVKAIIAHEYFHNWTGNRITCRDWFQLCLKEGFTVFREQGFTADITSEAVQRINDVATLKAIQFPEDQGPMAHAVRPQSFVEINNFYTATVYEKGAEIVRMMARFLGKQKFREATDYYFKNFDGQAITIEDFIDAMASANPQVRDFAIWYDQAGTPTLHAHTTQEGDVLTLHLRQSMKNITGDKPMPIPVDMAIFAKDGKIIHEETLLLNTQSKEFTFAVPQGVVLSLLRGFSAPVVLDFAQSDDDLLFLLQHETNGFDRWQAMGALVRKKLPTGDAKALAQGLATAVDDLIDKDPMLASRLFDVPSESELALDYPKDYSPQAVKTMRDDFIKNLSYALGDKLVAWYDRLHDGAPYSDDALSVGKRALKNALLTQMLVTNSADGVKRAHAQFSHANCLSERMGALAPLVRYKTEGADKLLAEFFETCQKDELLLDEWFGLSVASTDSIEDIERLMMHPRFEWGTPNRVRAVLGAVARRPVLLWSELGMAMYLRAVAKLDGDNPQLSARLLNAFDRVASLGDGDKKRALLAFKNLQVASKNAQEALDNLLKAQNQ